MAGQAVDVGTGATLTCGTTGFTGLVRLESIRWDTQARSMFPTSHLSTPAPAVNHRGNATFMPGRDVDPGEVIMAVQHNPQVRPPLHQAPELITLTFPKAPLDISPAIWSCMGFFVLVRDVKIPTDDKMLSAIVIKLTSGIAMTLPRGIGDPPPGEPVCVAVPFALAEHLTLCLDLEEPSGTRFDAVGSTDMTDLNGVTSAPSGRSGDAAVFDASLWQSLTATANPATTVTGPFSLAFWVKPALLGVNYQVLLAQGGLIQAGQYEWIVFLDATGHLHVYMGSGSAGVIEPSVATLALNTWAFVMIWHDGATLYLQVNNGAIESNTPALVSWGVGGGVLFTLGAIGATSAADHDAGRQFFTGSLDSIQLYDIAFVDQSDRDLLWNDGLGVRCACP